MNLRSKWIALWAFACFALCSPAIAQQAEEGQDAGADNQLTCEDEGKNLEAKLKDATAQANSGKITKEEYEALILGHLEDSIRAQPDCVCFFLGYLQDMTLTDEFIGKVAWLAFTLSSIEYDRCIVKSLTTTRQYGKGKMPAGTRAIDQVREAYEGARGVVVGFGPPAAQLLANASGDRTGPPGPRVPPDFESPPEPEPPPRPPEPEPPRPPRPPPPISPTCNVANP